MAKKRRTTWQRRSSGSKITAHTSKEAPVQASSEADRLPTSQQVKIIERKLGRDRVLGWAYYDRPLIEIDSRLRHKLQQEVLLHELLHIALPDLSEETVDRTAKFMANHTWRFGLRRVQR